MSTKNQFLTCHCMREEKSQLLTTHEPAWTAGNDWDPCKWGVSCLLQTANICTVGNWQGREVRDAWKPSATMVPHYGIVFLLKKQKRWSFWHCPVERKPPSGFGLICQPWCRERFLIFPPLFKTEFLEANMPGLVTIQYLNLCHLVLG